MFTASTRRLLSVFVPVVLMLTASGRAAVTINATASGELIPTLGADGATISNGDFDITGGSGAGPTGNGINESTTWSLDFTSDPDFAAFLSDGILTQADLTLHLTPRDSLITTDIFGIEGLPNIVTPLIQGLSILPLGEFHVVELDLLDFYTSDEILGIFSSGTPGVIPDFYGDDAIVSFAELDLNAVVPEPATIFVWSVLALCGLAVGSRRRFVFA